MRCIPPTEGSNNTLLWTVVATCIILYLLQSPKLMVMEKRKNTGNYIQKKAAVAAAKSMNF